MQQSQANKDIPPVDWKKNQFPAHRCPKCGFHKISKYPYIADGGIMIMVTSHCMSKRCWYGWVEMYDHTTSYEDPYQIYDQPKATEDL